jgi:site-specific DNA-methyltransferase (adenine-specific)
MSAVTRPTDRRGQLPLLHGDRRRWGLIEGEALQLLGALPGGCFDSLVTDPPYGLSFKGEAWDGGELADGEGLQAFTRWWAGEALRVMKPGAWAAVHGAPRTVHPGFGFGGGGV